MPARFDRLAIAIAIVLTGSATSLATAQPHGTDYLVTGLYTPLHNAPSYSSFSRVSPTGRGTQLRWIRGVTSTSPQMDPTNTRVLTAVDSTLYTDDIATNAQVGALQVPVPYVLDVTPHAKGGYLITSQSVPFHLAEDLATLTTLTTAITWRRVHGQDLWSGDYLMEDATGLIRVSADLQQRVALGPIPSTGYDVVQSHLDGDLRVVGRAGILRIDPRTGALATLSTLQVLGCAATMDRHGADMLHVIGQVRALWSGQRIIRFDAVGQISSTTNMLQIVPNPAGMTFAGSRELVANRRASPNRWDLRFHAPTEVGRPFVIALSATGFTPGIAVAGRTIPLRPDPVLVQSVTGGLAGVFRGNIGVVPAAGTVNASLDLRAFGNGLGGARLWVAAATLDAASPSGFSLITKPIVLVLD